MKLTEKKLTEKKLREMVRSVLEEYTPVLTKDLKKGNRFIHTGEDEVEEVEFEEEDLELSYDAGQGHSKVKSLGTGKQFTTTTDRLRHKRIGENKLRQMIRGILKEGRDEIYGEIEQMSSKLLQFSKQIMSSGTVELEAEQAQKHLIIAQKHLTEFLRLVNTQPK
jgi:hypothetical protein